MSFANFADFAALRSGFACLSEIYRINGKVDLSPKGVVLSSIPRERWAELSVAARDHSDMIRHIIQGVGQKAGASGRLEVVLSVLATERDGIRDFEVAALLVVGRGAIRKTVSLTSRKADWKEKLLGFTDWETVDAILPAAEGNNQRAMIGVVLQLAGIGRGKLEMIEAELPEEIDEAAHLVRGAEWMKAGLPRFRSAAGEALFYLMRLRSVHSRMIRSRKQGYYTAMGLAALHAAGFSCEDIAVSCNMPVSLVEKLVPRPDGEVRPARLSDISASFRELDETSDPRRQHCASRVWRGAAIYAHMLDRRERTGQEARCRLEQGEDLISIAADLSLPLRDLVTILSVRQEDCSHERTRYTTAVLDPALLRRMGGSVTAP